MRYLVGDEGQGAWRGHSGKLALYEDTAWQFFTPRPGWLLWDEQDHLLLIFDGTLWQPVMLQSALGLDSVRHQTTHGYAAGGEHATVPSHSIFLGVSVRVTQAIIGPRAWQLGVKGGVDRFGNNLPLASESEIRGPADPSLIYWQPTPIIVTPQDGRITGGRLLMSIFYIELPVPQLDDPPA